ncbi:MAG: matrixin family metalloprotease [Bradymonadaceae bacterium]|nr:matrixin family metalloprotease [Lujinxingiaceae bacterium]
MHTRRNLGVTTALLVVVLISLPSPSEAFVQTMTCSPDGVFRCRAGETPLPVQWPFLKLSYYIHEQGAADLPPGPDGLISDELEAAIIQSFDSWNAPNCSELELVYQGLSKRTEIGYQDTQNPEGNINLVLWQDEAWPYGSYAAVALTTVTFRPSTGFIVDADIELNGDLYRFTNSDNPANTIVDVRNTLTHEVGHFIGLDHSSIPAATMFSTAPPGELSKRILHSDDIAGLCHIYPVGFIENRPPTAPEDDGWCSVAPRHTTPTLPAGAALCLLGLAAWIRTRRRSTI